MKENNVVVLRQKEAIEDPLTEILRSGAKRLIAQAVEAEFEAFLSTHADKVLADGRQRAMARVDDLDADQYVQALTGLVGRDASRYRQRKAALPTG